MNNKILAQATAMQDALTAHRRWLHAHAETGFDLTETKQYVKQSLQAMGYSVEDCGKAGLVTTVGKRDGKVILLRADMDALPVKEESETAFSCPADRMHGCGHDFHTTMLLGAAKLLKEQEDKLNGTVKFMFQPAEEIFEGCKDMISHGVLENPVPDAAMMIHVMSGMPIPAGTVIVNSPGVSAPAADYFTIRVQGKGCHGSAPQNGVDPLTTAAHILIALQEIQTRELASTDEAVLTIGSFHGGNVGNVIPDSATLSGTIRTYDERVRSYLKERMEQIASGIAQAFRATAEITWGSGCPTLVNDADLSHKVTAWLTDLLGNQKVFTTEQLSGGKPSRGGGSEDFAYISQKIPTLMLALAAGEPKNGHQFPLHHPKVTFDESALPVGVAAFVHCAMEYLAYGNDCT